MIRATGCRAVLFVVLCMGLAILYVSPSTYAAELWASHGLDKVLRSAVPGTDTRPELRLCGSRGETVSGQAVFRSDADVAGVTASITDLRHADAGTTHREQPSSICSGCATLT